MRRPDPPPVRTDDVRVVTVGTVLWGVAFVVALLFRTTLRDDGHLWWLGACAAGFALGLVGLAYTRRRAAAIARDQATPARSQD
jgi:NO-binding membrane sensor protein with MHYT domain